MTSEAPRPGLLARAGERLAAAAEYVATLCLIRLFWLYEATLDIRAWGTEHVRLCRRAGERPLLVLWHGKGFVPIAYFHEEDLCLYASHTRDPNYSRLLLTVRRLTLKMVERLGYRVMDASQFASESRGVMQYVRRLREGGGAIAADGPAGPPYESKPGAAFLAMKTGVTLIPVGAAIRSGFRLDNWDYFEVPRVFSRASIVVELPIWVPADLTEQELEAKRLELEDALNRATRKAEERLGLTGEIARAASAAEA